MFGDHGSQPSLCRPGLCYKSSVEHCESGRDKSQARCSPPQAGGFPIKLDEPSLDLDSRLRSIPPVFPTRQEKDGFCFGDFEGCSVVLAQLMDRAAARPSLVATGLPVAIRATSSTKDTDIAPHSSTTESDI